MDHAKSYNQLIRPTLMGGPRKKIKSSQLGRILPYMRAKVVKLSKEDELREALTPANQIANRCDFIHVTNEKMEEVLERPLQNFTDPLVLKRTKFYRQKYGGLGGGQIIGIDDDGLVLRCPGQRTGFMPWKEALLEHPGQLTLAYSIGERVYGHYIGNMGDTVVLSLRLYKRMLLWEHIFEQKINKETINVTVTNVNNGGAVVEYMGVKGFMPMFMSITQPTKSDIGKQIPCKIESFDRVTRKIIVNSRRAGVDGRGVKVVVGDLYNCTITSFKPYGAFIEIHGAVIGLLHSNEVSNQRLDRNVSDIFEVNQTIKAVVIDFDEKQFRVSVSTKLLEQHPGDILKNQSYVFDNAETTYERLKTRALGQAALNNITSAAGMVMAKNNGGRYDRNSFRGAGATGAGAGAEGGSVRSVSSNTGSPRTIGHSNFHFGMSSSSSMTRDRGSQRTDLDNTNLSANLGSGGGGGGGGGGGSSGFSVRGNDNFDELGKDSFFPPALNPSLPMMSNMPANEPFVHYGEDTFEPSWDFTSPLGRMGGLDNSVIEPIPDPPAA